MKTITQEELNKRIELHGKWLNGEKDGIQLNLEGYDLSGMNLNYAELNNAKLNNAKLNYAELNNAELNRAELNRAELNNVELNYAKLKHTELNGAELNGAELYRAELYNTNLSGVKNSPFFNQYKWMCDNFKKDKEGFFVFKRIGNTQYPISDNWIIEEGNFIEETPNMNRTEDCGCGVNFGTKEYIKYHYEYADIWLCKLYFEDSFEICIPIYTDGKARCGRLQLLRKISVEEMMEF